jgi:hypothetical protein
MVKLQARFEARLRRRRKYPVGRGSWPFCVIITVYTPGSEGCTEERYYFIQSPSCLLAATAVCNRGSGEEAIVMKMMMMMLLTFLECKYNAFA